jgi:hypothetical protein
MAKTSGKYAYGICDISGFRYKLKDMRRTWDGLLVGPDQWNAKHPQLEPRRHITDAEALINPRPNTDLEVNQGRVFTNKDPIGSILTGVFSTSAIGAVEVTVDIPANRAVLDSQVATGSVGAIVIYENESNTLTGQAATSALGTVSVTASAYTTYTVTVASYLGANYFYIGGSRAPTLSLTEGQTYRFDQSDSSNGGHPLRFSTTSNGTHGGGSEYTTGVTTNGTPGSSGAYTQITVAVGAPTLYYYCTNHSGMGGTINT